MRVVVYGVGAIGGTIAVKLALAGRQVIGIARGRQLETIQRNGLTLRTPDETLHARFPVVGDPGEIDWRADDLVLLALKTQDTLPALERLRAAGVTEQPIVCTQNGISNEPLALRFFPNVYSVVVMMPALYTQPGEVAVFSAPKHGIYDVGRFPDGTDATTAALAKMFNSIDIVAAEDANIRINKYAKLLNNLANAVDTAMGDGPETKPYYKAARDEAERVLQAAGIAYGNVSLDHPRRKGVVEPRDVPGVERVGSSSAQSLARGAGSIETDYLNGEIVLLGRLFGVPTPVNSYFTALTQRMVREGRAVGSVSADEVRAALPGVAAAG